MVRYRLLLFLLAAPLFAQDRVFPCPDCATWNVPQEPFKIYGNVYYVGTHGLSSILITSPAGHILIDGAPSRACAADRRQYPFAGFSRAELQKLSGARVAASRWTADVMRKGVVPRSDPQFGVANPIARIAAVDVVSDGQALRAGALSVTAHLTPGHTPGGTSWTWRSCEGSRCLNLVYADSLTPVSADDFYFTRSKEYTHAVEGFERSYKFLDGTPCDILVTPHPGFTRLWERLEQRRSNPDALIDATACRNFAASSRELLKKRLATERGK